MDESKAEWPSHLMTSCFKNELLDFSKGFVQNCLTRIFIENKRNLICFFPMHLPFFVTIIMVKI